MGLTVAEAFMLVAFVLLMLLLFWRHQVQDEVDLASQLSPEERQALSEGAVPVPPERLEDLERQAERASGVSEEQLRALRGGAVMVPPERLEDLERQAERASGVSEEQLQALRGGAVMVPPERLEDLERQAERASGVSEQRLQALKGGAVPVPPERLEDLERQAERASGVSEQHLQALRDGAVPVPPKRLEDLERQAARASGVSEQHLQALRDGAVPVPPKRLEDLERQAARASGVSEQRLQALKDGAVLVPPKRLEDLEERAGLTENPARRALAEAAAALEPGELRKLTQLARDPKALSADTVPVSPERLAKLEGYEQWAEENEDEITEALDLRRALDPEGESSNEELMARIEDLLARERAVDSRLAAVKDRLAEDAAARGEFIDNLKRELAADMEKAGGKIDPSGRVVFPETVVFETGSAVIQPGFKAVLDDICPRWLAELRKSADRFDIDEIRIEGHSSPEWASAQTKRDAWVANLGLSQRRAQSVLTHCLDHAAGTSLGEWARRKLTAVGYSSSRPVKVDGREDPGASRRVVLGHEFSRDRLIADLGDAGRMEAGSGAIQPIGGKALVIDADTIKVGDAATRIRLDGIDAPELKQPCIAADGSEWLCGREAGLALEQRIAGRNVVCERLRPGLVRLRGVCRIEGEEAELNRWLVEAGWAFAFVKSSRAYAGDEAAARAARRGMWSGRAPMSPWEWRRNRKRAAATR